MKPYMQELLADMIRHGKPEYVAEQIWLAIYYGKLNKDFPLNTLPSDSTLVLRSMINDIK